MIWVIVRACVQSITIDEADGYLSFASRSYPSHWTAHSTNHLLNSLVVRLVTTIFGLSTIAVRMPALIGAAVYICAVYYLVRLIAPERLMQLALFVCLVYNPFVMDYLVAARGYSLALAFLMAAIAIGAHALAPLADPPDRPYRACVLCSLSVALSFCANFSFAFVDATALALLTFWFCRRRGQTGAQYAKLLSACILPGLLLTLFLPGSILANRRQITLVWGAKSLRETALDVIRASVYWPNSYLLSPPIHRVVSHWRWLLLGLLAAACLFQLAAVLLSRHSVRDARSRWLGSFALWSGAILAGALAIHWMAYRLFGILMPLGRTAVFIPPICLLAAGALVAIRAPYRMGTWAQNAAITMLCLTGLYFVACLRLTWFKEWKFNEDAKQLYSVVSFYNHTYGVREVSANWRYVGVLNFYRVLSGRETLQEVPPGPYEAGVYPPGKPLYVLFFPMDIQFIRSEKLKVVYHNDETEATVAIRPEAESSPCPAGSSVGAAR
jgi:hypothetical protein